MLVQIITENGQKKIKPLTADAGAGSPVGTVIVVCSNQIPSNYLALGTQYDTSLYPVLYALLGTDTTPTASALGLPTLTSGQYAIKATSGLTEGQQDNVVAQINEQRSYSTEEHLTGEIWKDGKPVYSKEIEYSNRTIETGGGVLLQANAKTSTEKIVEIKALYVSTNEQFQFNDFAYFSNNDLYTINHLTDGTYNVTVSLKYTKTTD